MSKKEELLKRYLETHTLADYNAYEACPEDAIEEVVEEYAEPVRRGLKTSDGESSLSSRKKRG